MKRFLKISTLFLIGLAGCKPDPLPLPIDESPVFKLEGSIDGVPINLAAGEGGYYMDSQFEEDTTSVMTFNGAFRKTDCPSDCTEEMTISIRDRKLFNPDDRFNINRSLFTGSIAIAEPSSAMATEPIEGVYLFASDNTNLSQDTEFRWIFNGADTTVSHFPIFHFDELETVELSVTDPFDGCTDTWSKEVGVIVAGELGAFFGLNYINQPNGSVIFEIPYLASEVEESHWDFGDNTTGDFGSSITINHQYATPGHYDVTAVIKLLNGEEATHCTRIQSHDDFGCAAGFYICPCPTPFDDLLSTVRVDWTAASGENYTSSPIDVQQPSDSFFEILSIEPFENSLDGDKTIKIKARAKMVLFNTAAPNTDSITFESEELVFAVAYPDS